MMSRRSRIGEPSWRRLNSSDPSGARPRRSASNASFSWSTRRNSSVAVEPSMPSPSRRILDAGQLDEDAVEALALHDGLGHAELVDAVAQRQRVLLDREVLALADRGLA